VTIRRLLLVAAIAAAATAVAILLVDAPVARALGAGASKTGFARALADVLERLDRVTLMLWPKKEQLALALCAAGALAWWWRRDVGAGLLLVGLTHGISRTLGGHLKPLTGRLRPGEALARGHVDDSFWWEGGISFPSGHVAHYAALAFVVAYLWPRATWPAMAVLAFVITARVSANAHFVSDVTGSIAVAALACAVCAAAIERLRRGDRRR
jgi:hypothetical protein